MLKTLEPPSRPIWHVKTRLNSPGGVEHTGKHQRTVLGECIRRRWRKFKLFEVVAICDYLMLLFGCQAEHEIFWESTAITSDLFVEAFRRNTVQESKICIHHDFAPSNEEDAMFDLLG